MDTAVEVNNITDIESIINKSWDYFGKKVEEIEIKFYVYDERIDWETYIVTYRLFGEENFFIIEIKSLKIFLPVPPKCYVKIWRIWDLHAYPMLKALSKRSSMSLVA